MSIKKSLEVRSGSKCELCSATDNLMVYTVPPYSQGKVDGSVLLCQICKLQLDNEQQLDVNHWRCLNDSIWSTVPAVQVLAWRMLTRLVNSENDEHWPGDLLDIVYLEDETLKWAKTGEESEADENIKHLDSNGAILLAGDTVTLTKDLNVKGANFTAKRGTAVRNISLVVDNSEHIEGKVNGQQIVILTKFVKKTN